MQNKQDAEDIIQDMYILLDKYNVKLERIRYKDGINKFFMYTTIKNMSLQFFKKQKYHLDLDDIQIEVEEDEEQKVAFNKLISKVDSIVAQWNYYDRTVFEMYMYSGLSYRDIAYGTKKKAKLISNRKWLGDEAVKRGNKISVSSMFNTIKQCRIKLQEELMDAVLYIAKLQTNERAKR